VGVQMRERELTCVPRPKKGRPGERKDQRIGLRVQTLEWAHEAEKGIGVALLHDWKRCILLAKAGNQKKN